MAVYNVEKINNWLSKFSKAKTDYNDDYLKYKDTYIYTTSESTINEIKRDLNKNYDRIQRIYKNIYDQWNRYLNDLKATDNYLAGTGSAGSVKASSVSSKLSKLPKLKKYEAGTYEKLSAVNAKIGTIKTVGWTDGKTTDENITNVIEKTGATISVATMSVLEGVGIFAEGLVDCAALVVGGVGTALNYTYGFFANDLDTSDELNELMWKDVRAFVSKEHVKSAFDSFYEKTDVGKSMKENAIGFDTVRSIGNEVGEVVGAVTVSALTGGVVNPAVLYGASKVGNHTEENWQDESTSTAAGLVKGVFQGVGDGVFFAIGLKGDKVMKTAVTEAVKQGGKQTFKKVAILGGKTLFECGCSVAQDGSNILLNTLFSGDTVKTQDGEVVKLDTFGDKLNYYYQEAGGAQGLVTSMATAGILSFTSDYVDINKIGKNVNPNAAIKNADINTSGVKKNMGDINSKNIDVSLNSKKINPDVNIDSLKKEYNELLNKSKESWFVNAKKAGDNHWAWDLNEVAEVDKAIKRMKELEGTLGIKETGVPESKIHDYSGVKKEADELVHKISKEPIPGFENINTNSPEYKKAIQDMYSKPSPSGKQDLSQIENQFSKNGNFDLNKTYSENLSKFSKDGISYEQYATQNGINIKDYGSEMDLALDVGDENWYLVQVIKNNVDEKNWPTAIKKPRSELNTNELINAAGPFLKQKDIINLNEIEKRLNMKNLSLQNQNTLSQFQRAGGCEINGMLRGKSYSAHGIHSLYELEMEMNNSNPYSGYGGANQKHPRLVNKNYSIVDEIDDIIKNNCNTSTIKGVSYLTSVGSNVPTKRVLDIIDSFGSNSPEALQAVQDLIGLDITDPAYNSKTIPPTRNTDYSKRFYNKVRGDIGSLDIKVESYISPGCGAYIDTYGGIENGLGEMLIKRNCNQKIVDAYIDPNTSKLVLVTLYT